MTDFATQHQEFAETLLADQTKGARKRVGSEIRGRCPRPSHEDKHPSFSYNVEQGCYACSCGSGKGTELWAELGWTPTNGNGSGHGPQPSARAKSETIHVYQNGNRKVIPRNPDGSRGTPWWEHKEDERWAKGTKGAPGLYRQDKIADAEEIALSESESDCDALAAFGLIAVCTGFGAGVSLKDDQAELFREKTVTVFEHQDPDGREYAAKCRTILEKHGARAWIVAPPPIPEGYSKQYKDIRDYIKRGGTKESVEALVKAARTPKSKARTPREILESAAEAPKPIPSGFQKLDESIGGGFVPGTSNIFGGYVGNGKTRLLAVLCLEQVRRGNYVLFVSGELSAIVLVRRILPESAHDARLYIIDWKDAETVEGIVAEVKALVAKLGKEKPLFIAVDYSQLIRTETASAKDQRYVQVGEVARALHRLAEDENAVVLAAAQLSRESQKGDGKPQLTHFRESGGIEQNADTCFGNVLEGKRLSLYLLKNRYGPVGTEIVFAVDFDNLALREYTDQDAEEDRLGRIRAEIEERVLAEGKLTRRDLCGAIRVGGKKAKASEITACVLKSPLVTFDKDGKTVIPKGGTVDLSGILKQKAKS